jgi:hypothetical protein
MQTIINGLVSSLSLGVHVSEFGEKVGWDPVGRLARVYEVARNALEYRADHLVRRAAIERILRRQLVFKEPADKIATDLILELKWARYVSEAEIKSLTVKDLSNLLSKYVTSYDKGKINRDWMVGLASAEIEEKINPNRDYHQFTTFAYHVIKKRLSLPDIPYLDLVLYTCVDKVYSQSDNQQLAFHLWKLIRNQLKPGQINDELLLEETQKQYILATTHKLQSSLGTYIRQQMPPLVLIRDMYFSDPKKFAVIMDYEADFSIKATEVLDSQLSQMRKRMNTAATRSLIYVFLTKMLLIILLEIPLEKIFKGNIAVVPLLINLAFPVILMWYLSARIRLPDKQSCERLVTQTWKVIHSEKYPVDELDMYIGPRPVSRSKWAIYYCLYAILFLIIFTLLGYGLKFVGFGLFNIIIFLFFLCVVSFFAYRIRQTAQVYTFKPREQQKTAFVEVLALPVVVVGSVLSREVSRLNFLVFIFDFVLEATFKIILRFLDSWMAFLSVKRDEAIG